MGFSLPAVPYPPARPEEGYWAPVTSTINWCEEDYYLTLVSILKNISFSCSARFYELRDKILVRHVFGAKSRLATQTTPHSV